MKFNRLTFTIFILYFNIYDDKLNKLDSKYCYLK